MDRVISHFLLTPTLFHADGMAGKLKGVPAQIGGKRREGGLYFEIHPEEIRLFDQFRLMRASSPLQRELKSIHFLVDEPGIERWLFRGATPITPSPSMECYAILLAHLFGCAPLYLPDPSPETILWLSTIDLEILHTQMESKKDPFGRLYAAVVTSRRRRGTLFECTKKLGELEKLLLKQRALQLELEKAERALLKAESRRRFSFVSFEKCRLEMEMRASPLSKEISSEEIAPLIEAVRSAKMPLIPLHKRVPSPPPSGSPTLLTYPSGMPLELEDGSVFGEDGELLARPIKGGWELFG